MQPEFFAQLILGHLVGDYVLQNKWMAMGKSGSTFKCMVHCLIYTEAVCVFTYPTMGAYFWWPFVVWLSHFPIDRWSLADKWHDFFGGRNIPDFIIFGHKDLGTEYQGQPMTVEMQENHRVLRGGFTSVVYTATDNTFHLVLMYYGAKILIWLQ